LNHNAAESATTILPHHASFEFWVFSSRLPSPKSILNFEF